jgi:putative PIN family toxin of toxin-antitoxin system
MRVVLDTNTVISGIFWGGHPRTILQMARSGAIAICTSQSLLDELIDVLSRPKFSARLTTIVHLTPEELVADYAALAEFVTVKTVERVVPDDPDDDQGIACALMAKARYIVSGDKDLLDLSTYGDISILKADQFLARVKI